VIDAKADLYNLRRQTKLALYRVPGNQLLTFQDNSFLFFHNRAK
jgi:hypothetical protein